MEGFHPGDFTIEQEGAVRTMMLFERAANQETLGPRFFATEPDEKSPTGLFVYAEAASDDEFIALRESAGALKLRCTQQEYEEHFAISKRLQGLTRYFGETYRLVVKDGREDAGLRRALWLWCRDVMWRIKDEGWITFVTPGLRDGVAGPVSIYVHFHAAGAVDPDVMRERFGHALVREYQRLEAGPGTGSVPTPWP